MSSSFSGDPRKPRFLTMLNANPLRVPYHVIRAKEQCQAFAGRAEIAHWFDFVFPLVQPFFSGMMILT